MQNTIKTFRDLLVWQKSMGLVTNIYDITRNFPKDELFGIVSQIRRCAVSIPSNIAEGYGRNSTNDYLRFLRMSVGSLFELQTQIEISYNIEYLDYEKFNDLYEKTKELERMLSSMIRKIKD